jgi:antitoxin MazE
MTAHLIDIGNSKGLKLPKNLIEKYDLDNELDIKPMMDGIFISKKKNLREGWDKQIKKAIASGDIPDDNPLENINSDWDNTEWTWPG